MCCYHGKCGASTLGNLVDVQFGQLSLRWVWWDEIAILDIDSMDSMVVDLPFGQSNKVESFD